MSTWVRARAGLFIVFFAVDLALLLTAGGWGLEGAPERLAPLGWRFFGALCRFGMLWDLGLPPVLLTPCL